MDWNTTNTTDYFNEISLSTDSTSSSITSSSSSSNSSSNGSGGIGVNSSSNSFQFHTTITVTNHVIQTTISSTTTQSTAPNATTLLLLSSTSTDTNNQTLRIYPALTMFEDALDPKYIEKINTFWLEFYPPNPRTQYTIAFIYILIYMIGCCGNALVIYMFLRCKSLRTPANILIMNLAISDFFMVAKCPIAIYNSFRLGPALGDWGCRLYGFLGGLTGTASITTLTAISIDRYHVVVYPLDPLRSTSKLRSRLTLIFIWLYSLIFSIIPLLEINLSNYIPEGYLTTCSFDYLSKSNQSRLFMFIFFIGAWCLPFFIITYCYIYILKVVAIANSIQSSKDKNKTELKLTAIVIGVIMLWFIAWTPYAIVALIGITGHQNLLTPFSSMIPAIFCKISACINPYIYAVTHPRFRMEFRRIFLGNQNQRLLHRNSTLRSSNTTRVPLSRNRIVHENIKMDTIQLPKTIQSITNHNNNNINKGIDRTTCTTTAIQENINHHHHQQQQQQQHNILNSNCSNVQQSSQVQNRYRNRRHQHKLQHEQYDHSISYQSDDLQYQHTDLVGDIDLQIITQNSRTVHSDDGQTNYPNPNQNISTITIEKEP